MNVFDTPSIKHGNPPQASARHVCWQEYNTLFPGTAPPPPTTTAGPQYHASTAYTL